eukprot:57962-Hanusia_phi.AAC.1
MNVISGDEGFLTGVAHVSNDFTSGKTDRKGCAASSRNDSETDGTGFLASSASKFDHQAS